ncbi:HAD-IA family hydrolase [Kitasatospora sp. NPDC056184]|uniref:HAD-IA family hydrolase n=1 Tax=Kitasatospora sp. NPDC056184 TaxID=3345738 RepID=UPI0035E32836
MTANHAFPTVVFDLDGVLIDSFGVMRQAFAVAYREVVGDGEPPFEEYRTHQGRYFPDIMRLMGLPGAMERPFVEASHRLIREVQVYPDVPMVLARLRECGVRTAIATGKSGDRARAVLDVVGLLPLLDAVVGSDEVDRPKPAPDIVREGLRRIGSDPADAVMVGDAVIDIQSGRAAGTATAAALWGETDADQLLGERPDFVLAKPAELLALVPGGER